MRLSMKASKIQNIQYMREIGDETPTPISTNQGKSLFSIQKQDQTAKQRNTEVNINTKGSKVKGQTGQGSQSLSFKATPKLSQEAENYMYPISESDSGMVRSEKTMKYIGGSEDSEAESESPKTAELKTEPRRTENSQQKIVEQSASKS